MSNKAKSAKKEQSKLAAAFFDVDNTILRGSSSFLFGKSAFERKFFSRKDFWRFAWHQFVFIWKGENNTKLSALKDRALALVEGQLVSDLQILVDEVYDKHIKLKLWPETVRLAKDHIKQGREVWLVTAAPQELGDVIAHELGLPVPLVPRWNERMESSRENWLENQFMVLRSEKLFWLWQKIVT